MTAIDDIEKVVAKAAKEALELEDVSQRLFALKILAPYYTILRKLGPPEDEEEHTFSDFAEAMHGEENGNAEPDKPLGVRDRAGGRAGTGIEKAFDHS